MQLLKTNIILTIFLGGHLVFAQMSPTIQSGRPGQGMGAGVVGSGTFQIQSGVDFIKTEAENNVDTLLFSNVIRAGITKDFEVSAVVNYQNDKIKLDNASADQSGISGLQLGFRSRILPEADGWRPALAIQSRFKLDSVSNEYRPDRLAPVVRVSAVHDLSGAYSLTHNLAVSYSGTDAVPSYLWTSSLGYSLTDKTSIFIEAYGSIKDNYGSNYMDAGFDCLLSNDLKLDFSAGWGHNRGITETFASLGVSWRAKIFEPISFQ